MVCEIKNSAFVNKADHKTNNGHGGENEEQNLRDLNGARGDTTKTKYGCYQRNDQKNDRVMQHVQLLSMENEKARPEGTK